MYESRLHATNGVVSLALDARNAELLELVNERLNPADSTVTEADLASTDAA